MTIDKYIKKIGGASKAARIFGVKKRSVQLWQAFKSLPRDEIKLMIKNHSGGKCSYKDMIDGYYIRQN